MNKTLFIKKSAIQGRGVFAKTKIQKDDDVFVFSKRIIKIRHKPGCNCKVCRKCIQIGKFDWMYPYKGSFGWNLNHNCNPSCGIKGRKIVAIKNIKPGDEITIDYSTTNADTNWKMKCLCKAKNCRKIIKGVKSLPKSLYKKYRKLMPEYVMKAYLFKNQQ